MNSPSILDGQAKESAITEEAVVDVTESHDPGVLPPLVVKELVQLFKLFSDETRLKILHFLMHHDELNVRTLCEMLSQSQPAVSHHLALLRVAGLIECRRDGKHNFYHIMPSRFQELVEMMFRTAPNQASRICFESFTLSYQPTE
jgi:ArsR family transcriptional regulator